MKRDLTPALETNGKMGLILDVADLDDLTFAVSRPVMQRRHKNGLAKPQKPTSPTAPPCV
jgi:hypothetical protein